MQPAAAFGAAIERVVTVQAVGVPVVAGVAGAVSGGEGTGAAGPWRVGDL